MDPTLQPWTQGLIWREGAFGPELRGCAQGYRRARHTGAERAALGPFLRSPIGISGRTRTNLIKIVFWDRTGLCLFIKRLVHGAFLEHLQRHQFGRRPQQLDADQLGLAP